MAFQRIEHVGHRQTCINDVLDDDDRTTGDVEVESNHFPDGARRACALIGSKLDEGYLTMQVYLPKEVCCEDEGTVEDSQEDWFLPGKVAAYLVSHTLYLLLQF